MTAWTNKRIRVRLVIKSNLNKFENNDDKNNEFYRY